MRVFVALDVPRDVVDSLAAFCARLKPLCREARWVRLEGVHVALKFIGEAAPELVEKIRAALGEVHNEVRKEVREEARAFAPIELRFAGLGFFPSAKRPRVFWAGVQSGPALGELAAAIETRLEPLGIPREKREFHPHLTLARFDPGKGPREGLERLRAAAGELAQTEFGRAAPGEFHLYESILKRGGAEYTRLATYSFLQVSLG